MKEKSLLSLSSLFSLLSAQIQNISRTLAWPPIFGSSTLSSPSASQLHSVCCVVNLANSYTHRGTLCHSHIH